jgi:hypothetical protein
MLLLTFLVHMALFHRALFTRAGGGSFVKASSFELEHFENITFESLFVICPLT